MIQTFPAVLEAYVTRKEAIINPRKDSRNKPSDSLDKRFKCSHLFLERIKNTIYYNIFSDI